MVEIIERFKLLVQTFKKQLYFSTLIWSFLGLKNERFGRNIFLPDTNKLQNSE